MSDVIGRGIIEIGADASTFSVGMEAAKRSIGQFEDAAVTAGANAGAALDRTGARAAGVADSMDAATRRFVNSIEREIASVNRSRAEFRQWEAERKGISASVYGPLIARLTEAQASTKNLGVSAAQTAAALRGVPAQLTDIIVSLQGGQAPLTVFLQQGGQLRDMFGSAGAAARALGSAVGGLLVNPLVLAAGAVASLAAAYNAGSKESDAYARALILTGNATGTTRDALAGMAAEIDKTIGTQAQAAEALAALAATGRVAAGNLQDFATTAIRTQRATGQAVTETVKAFADLGKDPVDASRRLNEETNYLTLAVYEQIKALQEAGRVTEAATLAQRAYADEMDRRSGAVVANLGLIERGWRGVKDATQEAIDAALNIGRTPTRADQVAGLQAEIERRQRGRSGGSFSAVGVLGQLFGPSDDELRKQIQQLQTADALARDKAAAEGEAVRIQRAGIEAAEAVNKVRQAGLSKQEQLNRALADYRRQLEDVRRANPASPLLDPAAIARDEAGLRERFKDKAGPKAREYQDDAGTRMLQQLRQQEAALREQLDTEEKIGAAQRARAEFETLIADLKEKRTLTADQKSLVANQAAILTQLRKNELIEDEVKLAQDAAKAREKAERERLQLVERGRQIDETIAQQRQTRQEQYDRELGSLGMGSAMRRQVEEQRALYREADRLQAQLVKATPISLLGSDEYLQASTRIKAALDQALADQQDYFRRVREAQQDWTIGASEALNDYLDSVRNVAQQSQQAFTRAFTGLEDVLTDALGGGSLNFDALGRQITAEINRSIIRQNITGPLAEWLQGQLGAGAQGGFARDLLGSLFGGSVLGVGGIGSTAGPGGLPLDAATGALRVTIVAGLPQLASAGGGLAQSLGGFIRSGFSSLFGGGFSAFDPTGYGITSGVSSLVSLGLGGGRAAGGPVYANTLHEVAEDGPELLRWRDRQYLLTGSDGGRVEPLRQGGGGRTVNAAMTINVMPGADRRSAEQAGAEMSRKLAIWNSRNN